MEKLNNEILEEINKLNISNFKETILKQVKGQDEEINRIVSNIYGFLQSWSIGKPDYNFTTLVAGPSGVGKTETYEAIKDYFTKNLPSIIISRRNSTSLSEAGYIGEDAYSLLLKNAGDILKKGTLEICFFDEFDKIAQTKNNERLQGQFLQIIEGNEIYIKKIPGEKKTINTRRILFILCGAFTGIEDIQKERKISIHKQDFGFTNHISRVDITHEDLVNYGFMAELAGRICSICNYHELDDDTVIKICKIKLKKYESIFKCKFNVSSSFYQNCITDVIKTYGARELDAILNKTICQYCITLIDKKLDEIFLDCSSDKQIVVKYK